MTPALPTFSQFTAAARYSPPASPADRPPAPDSPVRASLRAMEARIRRYNSDIEPASDTFRAAVLLLASLEFGQNLELLARRTGLQRSFVSKCARRLIDNGVWIGGITVAEWSADDEASGAFWNDVAVAEGKLCRRASPEGEIEWAPAGYWNKSYEFIEPSDQPLTAVYRDPTLPAPEADPEPAEPSPSSADPGGKRVVPPDELFPGAVWLE